MIVENASREVTYMHQEQSTSSCDLVGLDRDVWRIDASGGSLGSLNVNDFVYRGEGNANIVLAVAKVSNILLLLIAIIPPPFILFFIYYLFFFYSRNSHSYVFHET